MLLQLRIGSVSSKLIIYKNRTMTTTTTMTTTRASRNQSHPLSQSLLLRNQHRSTIVPSITNTTTTHTNSWLKRCQTSAASPDFVYMKPWGLSMVESNGDYRKETWIEDLIGGPLYEHQKNLPALPVCNVITTMDRLIPTVIPLAKNEEEIQSFMQAADKFPEQVAMMQKQLQNRANNFSRTSSWLQLWWNTWCYLQVRDPVVINVSYFFHFCDDPTTLTMVQRGASILTAVARFRHQVATGQFPAETIGKGNSIKPLCSVAYKYMFNACRIPKLEQDSYRLYDPALHNHVIVSVRGQFFKVPLVHPVTQQPHNIHSYEEAIQECIGQATAPSKGNEPAIQLGWCTSSNRDHWANARSQLIETGGMEMEEALKELESGALLLCLDIDDTVVSRADVAQMLLHGSSADSSGSGGNRWFDKSIQLIVSANGKAGLLGEHSMMDGMPVVQLANVITKTTYKDCMAKSKTTKDRLEVKSIFSRTLCEKIRATAEPIIERGMYKSWKTGDTMLHIISNLVFLHHYTSICNSSTLFSLQQQKLISTNSSVITRYMY
jgi:carnitine O-acetyltransferase